MSYYNPRDQYYNGNQSETYQEEYVGGYQQEQPARNYYNPQIQENNHFYSTPDLNTGTPADDNDNASVVSSIYSQPSVVGTSPSNNMQYYQGISNTMEPQSLSYNEPPFHHDDEPMDYPPSPLAASTNTHSSAVGLTTISTQQQGLPLYDQNEKNYIPNYTEENQYNDFSPNSQSQFDVYNDFNNNYRKDESYDEEETRNNTLTGANGPNSYAMNIDNFSGTGKAARHSMTGEHFVVTPKKNRRCGFCTRKICVITTFVILVVLAAGMFFVWPRVPKIEIFPPIAVGDAEITLSPVAAKMQMELQIELDNRDNWLPYKFNSFNVDVFNAARISSFNRQIATGNKKGFSISGKAKSTISIPISIDYSGTEKNDPIVQDFISACTKPPEGGSKTPLNLRFDIKMFIWGLDWVYKPTTSKPVSDFQCPFEAIPPSPDAPPPEEPAIEQQPETPPEQPVDPKVPEPAKEPAVPPEDPAVPAKEPAVPPEDPAVPAKDPAVPPEDPAVPKDPAVPPEDPAVPAKDPAVPPEQPAPPA